MVYIFIIAVILAVDLLTKKKIINTLAVGQKKVIIKDKFELWHIKNTGFSFSMFSGHIKMIALVASAITSLVVGCFLRLLFEKGEKVLKLGFAFAIGGALGNLYERIFKNGVTDFIYIKIKKFPIFNVADIFVFLGSLIIMAATIFRKRI